MLSLTLILLGFALYSLSQIEDFSWAENRGDISLTFLSGLVVFNFGYMLRENRKEKAENESEDL
jgi:hypothetical protein